MALRAENSSSNFSSSHLVGLPVFWNDPTTNLTMDWDKSLDLFQVAMIEKYSISITELTRAVTEQTPRVRPLMGDLDEDPANKKTISVMYLSENSYRILEFSIDRLRVKESIAYGYIRSQTESNNVYSNMTQLAKEQIILVNKTNNSKHK